MLGTRIRASRVGLHRVSLFSTIMNESYCDRSTFEPKSRARGREPVPISGEGWDRMVALKESGTRTLGSM